MAQAITVSKSCALQQVPRRVAKAFFRMEEDGEIWETPSVFIACTEVEAARIHDAGELLMPAVFEHKPTDKWFKVFPTVEAALDCALRAFTSSAAKAATEETVWYVLKLDFTDQQWLQLLLKDSVKTHIKRGPGPLWKQFQVGGELPLQDVAKKEWNVLTIAPIGFGTWAEKRLSNSKQWPDMTCGECGKEHVTVWLGNKRNAERHSDRVPEHKGYCAECWHKYLTSKFP